MPSFQIKKIIVPIDFSETSLRALEQATYLARLKKAELILIHVLEDIEIQDNIKIPVYEREKFVTAVNKYGPKMHELESRIESDTNKDLTLLVEKAKKKGALKTSYIIESGKVYKQICNYAKVAKADLIVMGTHGIKGFREFVIGSNTFRVVREAECPVLSIQNFAPARLKKIMLPFRDKAHSRESVNYAIELAKIYNARIHILGIDTEKTDEHFEKMKKEAQQIKKIISKHQIASTVELTPSTYDTEVLLNHAKKQKADLIAIMADMDRLSLEEFIVGPVVKQIVNHSPIPVLSIRPSFYPGVIRLKKEQTQIAV